jgi:hypothetical protein
MSFTEVSRKNRDEQGLLGLSSGEIAPFLVNTLFGTGTGRSLQSMIRLAEEDTGILKIELSPGVWIPSDETAREIDTNNFVSSRGILMRVYKESLPSAPADFTEYLRGHGVYFEKVLPEQSFVGKVGEDADAYLCRAENSKLYVSFLLAKLKD